MQYNYFTFLFLMNLQSYHKSIFSFDAMVYGVQRCRKCKAGFRILWKKN